MSDISIKRIFKFPPNRLGYLVAFIEPVSSFMEEDQLRQILLEDDSITALPIETEGGVSGIIARDILIANKKLHFKQKTALELVDTSVPIFDAMDSMNSTVAKLMESGYQGTFLVYHSNHYLGIATVRDVLIHAARLRAVDMEQAKRVQDNFMVIHKSDDPRIRFNWFNQMAHEVGGDFIQWRKIDEKSWFLGLFDMAGKGVSAALSTSLITAYFSTLELTGVLRQEKPPRIIHTLHRLMQTTLIDETFLACAFVFFDLEESVIRMYNCGLGPIFAYLTMADGRTKHMKVDPNLPPLGFEGFPEEKIIPAKLKWVPGVKLIVSTDGLPDMKNPEGQQFGDDKVEEFIATHGAESGENLKQHIVDLVLDYIGAAPQADDISLAIVEWPLGEGAS